MSSNYLHLHALRVGQMYAHGLILRLNLKRKFLQKTVQQPSIAFSFRIPTIPLHIPTNFVSWPWSPRRAWYLLFPDTSSYPLSLVCMQPYCALPRYLMAPCGAQHHRRQRLSFKHWTLLYTYCLTELGVDASIAYRYGQAIRWCNRAITHDSAWPHQN